MVSETTKFEDLVSLPESPKHDHEIIECSLEWEAFPQALRSSVRTVERLVDAVGCGEGEAWDVLVDVKFLLGNYEWLVPVTSSYAASATRLSVTECCKLL